jgi:predicted nuclease of predicted toxin-antitoxin system
VRILIDECVPKKFKFSMIAFEHECVTVPEAGLAGKENGELLALAETSFDVFLTLDKGFEYQQTLASKRISIIIIRDIGPYASKCAEVIRAIQPGQLVVVGK